MSRKVFPIEYGTFTRMKIVAGPFSDDCYFFALYFIAPDNLDQKETNILFTFNDCAMYPGEVPDFQPNEYRRFCREPLPLRENPHGISNETIQRALDDYHASRKHASRKPAAR